METKKESQANNEPEPSQQEDKLEVARTMLGEGASIDEVVAQSGLNRERVLGIKSGIARRSKRFNARSNSTEPKTEPEIQIQAENKPQENKTIPFSGAVKVPPKLWDELDELDKKNLKGWKANVLTWNEMEKEQVQRNDGHGVPSYGSGDDDLKRAKAHLYESMAETEEMDRLDDMKQRRYDRHTKTETKENPYEKLFLEIIAKTIINNKGEQLGIKELVELSKLFAGSSMKETIGLVDYIQHSQREGQNVTLNDIALKLEEMKQNAALEDKKLNWEMAKWERQEAKGDQYVELAKEGIKAISSGAIGDTLKALGSAKADQIRASQGGKIPTVNILCPQCGNKFKANSSLPQVTCSICGAVLQRPEPQPQPSAEPQPTQPQQTEEEPKPQATKETEIPQEPKKPDVMENF